MAADGSCEGPRPSVGLKGPNKGDLLTPEGQRRAPNTSYCIQGNPFKPNYPGRYRVWVRNRGIVGSGNPSPFNVMVL